MTSFGIAVVGPMTVVRRYAEPSSLNRIRRVARPSTAFLFSGRQFCGLEDPVQQSLRRHGVASGRQRRLTIDDTVEKVVHGCGETERFGRGGPAERLRAEFATGRPAVDGD